MTSARPEAKRPSWVWVAAAILTAALAVGLAVAATLYQARVSRPVGEGELFAAEAASAATQYRAELLAGRDAGEAVRALRNRLEIEAVSLLQSGKVAASSAPELIATVPSEFLLAAADEALFAAVAEELTRSLSIDGVAGWSAGEVVYQVLQPLEDGSALILSYDISELLERRARAGGIRPLTVQSLVAATVCGVTTLLLLIGRSGARRRIWEGEREGRFHEARSRELEEHNRQLDEARHEAERALALAEEINHIRSEFVLMINHELRTPLTGVVTGAELLLDRPDLATDDRRAILADVVRDGRRLKDLISQMLTVARIENRGLHHVLRDVSVGDILGRVAEGSGRVVVAGGDDGGARTDPEALAQLLLSLADNAFTHGAGRVEVSSSASLPFEPAMVVGDAPAAVLWFLVADDGPGIEPDFLPRAFEKFEKRGRASGTGLGLYLAKMIVEGVNGCIAVGTGPTGTTMAVGVPSARAPRPVPVGS